MQFAMGILSLQAQQREAAARTQQLREAQAQQAAIEQQRLQLTQVGQAQEARHQAFAESQAAQATELHKQTLAFQVKEHEDMLKNQDAANIAKLSAGEDAFFRSGGPQPPPELFQGPEVEVEGVKKPAYRMIKIDVPGGTFVHKIEDVKTQEQFDDLNARQRDRLTHSILQLQQARYNQARADNYNQTVDRLVREGQLTARQVKIAEDSMEEVNKRARAQISAFERASILDPEAGKKAVALAADPLAFSSEAERRQMDGWRAISEAGQRLMLSGLTGGNRPAPPKSLTGTHPDEIQAKIDRLTMLLGGNQTPSAVAERKALGTNFIERPVIISPEGKITQPDLRSFTTRPPGGFSSLRTFYDEKGQPVGTELRSPSGQVLSATGTSPLVGTTTSDRLKGAVASFLNRLLPAPGAAPTTAPSSVPISDADKKQALADFRAGKISREELMRRTGVQ